MDIKQIEKPVYEYKKVDSLPNSYKTIVANEFVATVIRLNKNNRIVLDFGSGAGGASDYFDNCGLQSIRFDINRGVIDENKKDKVIAENKYLPFADHSFTGIHAKDVLVHIKDKWLLFNEFSRILEPGGILSITSVTMDKSVITGKEVGQHGTEQVFDIGLLDDIAVRNFIIENNPNIDASSLSPAFYKTSEEELIRIAQENGFELKSTQEWKPEENENDWYQEVDGNKQQRFVLTFTKKS